MTRLALALLGLGALTVAGLSWLSRILDEIDEALA